MHLFCCMCNSEGAGMKTIYGLIIIMAPLLILWGLALVASMLDKALAGM